METIPKGACAQRVDTLALKEVPIWYFGAELYTIRVHGPFYLKPYRILVVPL